MKVIVEDEAVTPCLLENTRVKWSHEVVVCRDGQEAWQSLQTECASRSAILDLMPKMDGLLVCKEIRPGRALCPRPAAHTKSQKEDLITRLEAGADDYLTKPKALTETASNSP